MSSLVTHNMKCTNLLSTMKPKYCIYGNLLFKLSIFEVNLQVAPPKKITAVDSTLTESGPTPKKRVATSWEAELRRTERRAFTALVMELRKDENSAKATSTTPMANLWWKLTDSEGWKIEEDGRSGVFLFEKNGESVKWVFYLCWKGVLNKLALAESGKNSAESWSFCSWLSDPMHNTTCRVVYLQSCLRFCAPSCNLSGTLMGPTLLVEGVNCVKLQCKEIAWDFAQTSTNINWFWLLQKILEEKHRNLPVINSFGGGGPGSPTRDEGVTCQVT